MSVWCTKRLDELVSSPITYGVVKPGDYDPTGIKLIRGGDILRGKISRNLRTISPAISQQYQRTILRGGELLVSLVGNPGEVALVPSELAGANLARQAGLIRLCEEIEPSFALYYFMSPAGIEQMMSKVMGSVQQVINLSDLKEVRITYPPLFEQQAIAAVLSSLDDKIDLLHRQNQSLEGLAETLFRQWFMEEAQDGWEFVELGKYVNCFNGVSYKSEDLNPSTIAMVTLKSFDRDGGFRLDGFKEFTGRHKEQHVVNQGDLVVAHTDITQDASVIGNPVLVVADPAYDKLVISMDLVKVTSKHEWLSNEFLYRMMRTREFKQHCLGFSNGSTVLHLSKEAIPSYEFFLPPKERIGEFTKLAKGLLGKKFENITQARTLKKLRDTLLPKLMSGEVSVAC